MNFCTEILRKLRKKRINKKWAKIYGYKYYSPLENGKTHIIDGAIYMNMWTYEYLLHLNCRIVYEGDRLL